MAEPEGPAPERSEEELRAQLEEELRQLKVADVLVQTVVNLSALGYRKLEEGDLEQARLAIDALRALNPVLAAALPVEVARDLGQAVASMQLAYAKAAQEAS